MLNVIPFRPDRRSQAERPVPAAGAEILFFTGVRYVRYAEAEEAADAAMLLLDLDGGRGVTVDEEERLLA